MNIIKKIIIILKKLIRYRKYNNKKNLINENYFSKSVFSWSQNKQAFTFCNVVYVSNFYFLMGDD